MEIDLEEYASSINQRSKQSRANFKEAKATQAKRLQEERNLATQNGQGSTNLSIRRALRPDLELMGQNPEDVQAGEKRSKYPTFGQ